MPQRDENYFHNWTSVIGAFFSILFGAVIFFLFIADSVFHHDNPYFQAVTYLILPGFLILSLILIPSGAWRERKRRQKGEAAKRFPAIDLNNPLHQRWLATGSAVFILFVLFSAWGAYRAYEFTESVVFCGTLCHQVMEPEYTAYQDSPHARVACVKCHIGPGADWYVRSKFSGMYQIYSALADKYSRPIETPVKNLRPAQETCEQCHWPQQFYGAVEQNHQYFLPDEQNSEWQTRMLIFVGGAAPPYGKGEGIHWHMNIKNKIYYIATDEDRLEIPWVKVVGPNGEESIYTSEGVDAAQPPEGEVRRMDCIDCHNRPSHVYKSPVRAVNEAIAGNRIDRTLPYVKREAVNVLTSDYATSEEAAESIRQKLLAFYEENYPEIYQNQRTLLDQSIATVVEIYNRNFFPEMKVSWEVYPDHIGHFEAPGCFRCHDGLHKTEQGKVITNNCNACHHIISQGAPGLIESSVDGLEFKHPEDIDELWKETSCFDCHTGVHA